ncbi:MAG: NADH-quinone oxidoreductase subunit I [Cyanobacteria bacterium SZAS-4]|nr:NADH-quinone oxidoreductase subunit I [Cyanobacteria bacterium SZAS-4]
MPNLISRAFDSIYQVFKGLSTVGGHTFKEPITEQYPDHAPNLPAEFRGRLALSVNPETGEHLCISCRQCERVCPDKCIEITAHKSPETNKLELIDFKIDHGLCMFCGLCTEVCPTTCIINTNDFEMADYTRESLIYDIKKLTLSQEESAYYFEKKEIPIPKPKPAKPAPAAAGAAAAAKPAAPAAAAAATADKPAAEAKPAADAKPAAEAKPAADAKPAAEAKPAADAKPAAEAKPAEDAKPAAEAKPAQDAKPAAEAKTEEDKPKES